MSVKAIQLEGNLKEISGKYSETARAAVTLQAERSVAMGMQVYQEGSYKIYRAGHNYIVHNAR